MKKGKDDDKPNAPMFPRLHVNDTDKGGPRAPPRNKMALYERLSIPSLRFNQGVMPPNPKSSTVTGPQSFGSQVTGLQGNYSFRQQLPPATSSHPASTPPKHMNPTKRTDNDNDFMVPVNVHSQKGQLKDNTRDSLLREKVTSVRATYSGCSEELRHDYDRDSQHNVSQYPKDESDVGSFHANSQKYLRNESEFQCEVSEPGSDQSSKSTRSSSTRENFESCRLVGNLNGSQEHQRPGSVIIHSGDAWLLMKSNAGSQSDDTGDKNFLIDSTRYMQNGGVHTPRCHTDSTEGLSNPVKANSFQKEDDRIGKLLQPSKLEKCDVSTVTVVDVVSDMSISPDDVVATLGQKHFWKVRRAIANQQRVFAVQVFELHRLIKVQQLIAGSPEDLLEDVVFLEKSSPTKKIRLEYVSKPRVQNPKCKIDSENQNHKNECYAENAVGKPSLSSVKTSSHLSTYPHSSGNGLQANMTADAKMSPWFFPQQGHQWLVPVMSPSEGLVYKPYPHHGFSGTFSGGCGPCGPASWAGSFMNSSYVWPSPCQGVGVAPGAHPVYLPPCGTPSVNSAVEQMNQAGGHRSFTKDKELSAGVYNSTPPQMRSDRLNQKDGTVPHLLKSRVRTESEVVEVQGSTASSPGEIVQGVAPGQNSEVGDASPPFSVPPLARVIRVVPHNRISATESVARIFQSIQEERKQSDSAA